jgi:hypothetical protein
MLVRERDGPLVLLSDVVSLGQVDEVDDGLGGQELELVDVLNLHDSLLLDRSRGGIMESRR